MEQTGRAIRPDLLLGRLRSDAFLGGHMTLDENAARTAIAPTLRVKVHSPLWALTLQPIPDTKPAC